MCACDMAISTGTQLSWSHSDMERTSLSGADGGSTIEPGVPVVQLSQHLALLRRDNGCEYGREFASLSSSPDFPWNDAILDCNIHKNRYLGYYPYDYCRVQLKTLGNNVPGAGYINASWIDGYGTSNAYIATQGPLRSTIDDFWRMVWEVKVPTIVMLTLLTEGGQVKCEQYWPDRSDEPLALTSGLMVTMTDSSSHTNFEIKTLLVKYADEKPLSVTHYYFHGWPDHGIPTPPSSLLHLMRVIRQTHPHTSCRPLLVHCSAGVGRTGTFIALEIVMQQALNEDRVDVVSHVQALRNRRFLMVQNLCQYIFIHNALEEFITSHGRQSLPPPSATPADVSVGDTTGVPCLEIPLSPLSGRASQLMR